jgi:hypothetical protein
MDAAPPSSENMLISSSLLPFRRITNITLGNGIDPLQAADYACNFERQLYSRAVNKTMYDQTMSTKTLEFFKKRQEQEAGLQNNLNASAQAQQAQAHAHAQAQARAMMNMQQMGRGMGQGPQQGFQQFPQQMPGGQMPQQPQQGMQQPQQQQMSPQGPQQQQQQAQMRMNMANQAGRGIGPNGQMMNMAGMQGRPQQSAPMDLMSRLSQQDRQKVTELATRMLAQAPESQKNNYRQQLTQRMTPQQIAEFHATGRDPLLVLYQNHAVTLLKNGNRQAGQAGPNQAASAAMMQQQSSQQSLQRQNMMNGAQVDGSMADFGQFNPNMESIQDQQRSGLLAQQQGQVVVPATPGGNRNPTPQPLNQGMANQQAQNQAGRGPQQNQPQPGQQGQQTPQQNMKMQQMKMNQATQQSPAQIQAQVQAMKSMQGAPQGNMAGNGGAPPSQSPAMDTLNTPSGRPQANMNQMMGHNMAPGGMPFGDQRFNQGIQRPNSLAFQQMLANMTAEQRAAVVGMPPEKLNEIMKRWQTLRQDPNGMNGAQANAVQMLNRQQGVAQMNQGNPNMAGPSPQGMQPNGQPGNTLQQQQQQQQQQQINQQLLRIPNPQTAQQAQMLMDSLDLPSQVTSHIPTLPAEVKKWKDLKVWMQRNTSLSPSFRAQLGNLQQRQFQLLMQRKSMLQREQQAQQQQAQQNGAASMTPGMNNAGQMFNQQQNVMQAHLGNVPPHMQQAHQKEAWMRAQQQQQQQQQQLRAQQVQQAQALALGQQQSQNQMSAPQAPMQPQQVINQMNPAAQGTPSAQPMSSEGSQQLATAPRAQAANRAQAPKPSPAQPARSLKRSTPDDEAEAAKPTAPAQQAPQPNMAKPIPHMTPQQIAALNPEQRTKLEQLKQAQLNAQSKNSDAMARLKAIGQDEQRAFALENLQDIPMDASEHAETATKLLRIAQDMAKVSKGLSRWFAITGDDARAKLFFRTRLRIMKQFADGDNMSIPKDIFSMRMLDIENARSMLESIAKDLASVFTARRQLGQQPGMPPQPQGGVFHPGQAQPMQQSQSQQQQQAPAQTARPQVNQATPLNATNLEKNAQALGKANAQRGKGPAQAQVPAAPTASQPPFQFGASSPHGNPSFPIKQKDINLQLPPRKKTKVGGPGATSQGATPSPQISKSTSPEMRRQSEPQLPPAPMFVCTEPSCEALSLAFSTEQALQEHTHEEHIKPREDPVKFVQETLADCLGLEPDGTLKAGTATNDKKDGDAGAPVDAWANTTVNPSAVFNNMGFYAGISGICTDPNVYRALTSPKDTPESSKDSGSSEPNSDISEGAALDIEMNWHTIDPDFLTDFSSTNLDGSADSAVDPMVLLDPPMSVPDWDDIHIDFSKPIQFDSSFYSMST